VTHVPRLRDALSRAKIAKDGKEDWLLEIGERIAHAKAGKEDWGLEIRDWLLGSGLLTPRSQSPDMGRKGGVPRSRDALSRGFCPAVAGHADAWMFNFSPQLRDALTRGFFYVLSSSGKD